jgi:hypothetical protein
LNNRPFKKLPTSRKELFLSIEKAALKPLPMERYEYAQFKKATVNIDYHVDVEGHYYSVPYQMAKKMVEVKYTHSTVEVIYKGKRVTTHKRSYEKGSATTIHEHRSKSHQEYLQWTPSKIIDCAQKTGPATANLVETIMSTKPHPMQGYISCPGILRLGKKYTEERLEAASKRAILLKSYSYKSVKSIVLKGFASHPIVQKEEVMKQIDPYPWQRLLQLKGGLKMTNQTIEKLYHMRLNTMAGAFDEQLKNASWAELAFDERVAMIVDREWTFRENRKLARRLKQARLKHQATVEDIDFRHPRGLDKSLILTLANCHWIRNHQNVTRANRYRQVIHS